MAVDGGAGRRGDERARRRPAPRSGCWARPRTSPAGARWTRPATWASAPVTCRRPEATAYEQHRELQRSASRRSGTAATGRRSAAPPARRQPGPGRAEGPGPPGARAGHHRPDRDGRLLPHGGRRGRPYPRGGHPLRHPRLRRGQLRQPPARHQRDRPARARPADGAVPVPDQEHAPGHRPGRGVGPPPGRVPDHLRRLRGRAHRLRLHDGDLPGAQRDQGRRRRDVAAAGRDRRDRQGLPAHPGQADHGGAHRAARAAPLPARQRAARTRLRPRPAARRPAAARRHAPVRRAALGPDPARPHRGGPERRGLPAQPARQGRRGDRRGDQAGRARRPDAVGDGPHAGPRSAAPPASGSTSTRLPATTRPPTR